MCARDGPVVHPCQRPVFRATLLPVADQWLPSSLVQVGTQQLHAHVCLDDNEDWQDKLLHAFIAELEWISEGLTEDDVFITDGSIADLEEPGFICSDQCCFDR